MKRIVREILAVVLLSAAGCADGERIYRYGSTGPTPGPSTGLGSNTGSGTGSGSSSGSGSGDGPVFSNGQAAALVFGQTDFVSGAANRGGAADATTLSSPSAITPTASGMILITDTGNNRVLAYSSLPSAPGAAASFVIGQPDFAATTASSAATGLSHPLSAEADDTRLVIADQANRRILFYSPVPSTSTPAATIAVGATSVSVPGAGSCSSDNIIPRFAMTAGNSLLALGSTRALFFSPIPTADDPTASLGLGTLSVNQCGSGATALSGANAAWTDGTRIAIADTGNNRVAIWNSFPVSAGQAPDFVLGQPDYSTISANSTGIGAGSMSAPSGIASLNGRFYVSDRGNNRVLFWASFPTTYGQPADGVLGQADFVSSSPGLSATTFSAPSGLGVDGSRLYVADSGNHRALVFTP